MTKYYKVVYVSPEILEKGKKHIIQLSGIVMHASARIGDLESFQSPFDTKEDAQIRLKEFQKSMQEGKGEFMLINY